MPITRGTRRALIGGGGIITAGGIVYLYRDDFTTAKAAGAINGTSASHIGKVVAVDTGSDMSQSGDQLLIANGTGSVGNPGYWGADPDGNPFSRIAGLTVAVKIIDTNLLKARVGFDLNVSGDSDTGIQVGSSSTIKSIENGVTTGTIYAIGQDDTEYSFWVMANTVGVWLFIAGGVFGTLPLLVDILTVDNTATLYAMLSSFNAVAHTFSADTIRVAVMTDSIPVPAIDADWTIDSPIRDKNGNVLVGDYASISGGELLIGAPSGAELLTNGDFSAWTGDDPDDWAVVGESGSDPEATERDSGQLNAGTNLVGGSANLYTTGATLQLTQTAGAVNDWYVREVVISAIGGGTFTTREGSNQRLVSYTTTGTKKSTHRRVSTTNKADVLVSTDVTIDSYSVKQINLVDCLGYFTIATSIDEQHNTETMTITDDTQAGWIYYGDANNWLLFYLDRVDAKAKVLSNVAGVQTEEANNAYTYSAGAETVVWHYIDSNGDHQWQFRHNNVTLSTTNINDAALIDIVNIGWFATDPATTFGGDAKITNARDPIYENLLPMVQ